MKKLSPAFFRRHDVVQVAKELLGKILVTRWDGVLTAGRIVETEAYAGITDKASHAYGGRRTPRNEVMYAPGGKAYVYICYGIHHLVNVVTHEAGTPHAVLIRALEPMKGIEMMAERAGKLKTDPALARGPGNLSKALGITTRHSGFNLAGKEIYIAEDTFTFPEIAVGCSPRIGVDYAGEDALLPYRFYIRGHRHVSGKPK